MGTSPPVTIPIGTSDPLDLTQGLPLFPGLGTARAGLAASSRSYKLFEVPILIVCTRLKIAAYAGYAFGVVGPAIAFLSRRVSVVRDNIPGGGQLTLTFEDGLRMDAGAFVGAYVTGGVSGALQVYLPKPWYKFWAFTWVTAFNFEKDFRIDLLDLMFTLINYLLRQRPNGTSFTKDTQNRLRETKLDLQGFGMAGSSTGVTPNLTATPGVTAVLNFANYVPKLREINLALAKIGGEISFGPTSHFQYPVTFNFTGFTVTGGIEGADEATYQTGVQYRNGNQVTARGDKQFNTRENPTLFTTLVKYETSVRLAISIHAHVKVAKFFCLGVNTPSVDLTNLLYRIPERNRSVEVPNSVTTEVGGGCVLVPNMSLGFRGPSGPEILTGEVARGTVTLRGFQPTSDANVSLEIQPPAATFPSSVTISAGSRSVDFPFVFQNQCMLTGNRDNPNETAPPSAIAPLQSFRVRAMLTKPPEGSCSDFQAESPLSITNRFIRCQVFRGFNRGISPPWDEFASAKLIADVDNPDAPDGSSRVPAVLWFPYVANEQQQPVPVTFTLLDENRDPYLRSDVELVVGVESKVLAPSCTFDVTLLTQTQVPTANPSFSIYWRSKGRETGYSNRFYLLVNAGCQYGQSEFWLDVYNWS